MFTAIPGSDLFDCLEVPCYPAALFRQALDPGGSIIRNALLRHDSQRLFGVRA
jgi:hypothetical protein